MSKIHVGYSQAVSISCVTSTLDGLVDQPQIHLIPVSGRGSELRASQEVEYIVLSARMHDF